MNAARIDPAEEHIKPAPKQLAMLAAEMRGWDYDDIRTALIACSQAGWTTGRIYRETFRLLLAEDAVPNDLRVAARNPVTRGVPDQGGAPRSPAVVHLLERARETADAATAALKASERETPGPRTDPQDGAA